MEIRNPSNSGHPIFFTEGRRVFTDDYHGDPLNAIPFILPFLFCLFLAGFSLFIPYTILEWVGFETLNKVLLILWNAPWLKKLLIFIVIFWIGGIFFCILGPLIFSGIYMSYAIAKIILNFFGLMTVPVQLEVNDNFLIARFAGKSEFYLWNQMKDFQVLDRPSGSILFRFSENSFLNITGVADHARLEKLVADKIHPSPLNSIRFNSLS